MGNFDDLNTYNTDIDKSTQVDWTKI